MSFREKSAWTCLLTLLAAYVPYFTYTYRLFEERPLDSSSVLGAFIGTVIFQVVALMIRDLTQSVCYRRGS